MSLFTSVRGNLANFVSSKTAKVSALAVTALAAGSTFAQEGNVTLPETGVDIGAYCTTAITSIGSVVAVCVGGYFAFKLVKIGIKWAGSLLSRG